MPDQALLVIDGGVLDVTVQLTEVLREEDGHGNCGPLLALLLVGELPHEVSVAPRARLGQPLHEHGVAVAGEDAKLEPARLGDPGQIRHVATAVR